MNRRTASATSRDPDLDAMVEMVQQLLLVAIRLTLESGSPEPARKQAALVTRIDDGVAGFDSGPPPAQSVALVVLTRWLTRPGGQESAARPDADEVLDWVEQNLGKRYRARARYMIGVLDVSTAVETVQVYAGALAEDFLPTLIWIASALVALYGDRDPDWLAREA